VIFEATTGRWPMADGRWPMAVGRWAAEARPACRSSRGVDWFRWCAGPCAEFLFAGSCPRRPGLSETKDARTRRTGSWAPAGQRTGQVHNRDTMLAAKSLDAAVPGTYKRTHLTTPPAPHLWGPARLSSGSRANCPASLSGQPPAPQAGFGRGFREERSGAYFPYVSIVPQRKRSPNPRSRGVATG